jgi:hypothetical protein
LWVRLTQNKDDVAREDLRIGDRVRDHKFDLGGVLILLILVPRVPLVEALLVLEAFLLLVLVISSVHL